ncbi:MAG TPA: dipeptidase [Gemmatimonadales bacterium]|nr:dipeptidase [Gemmatimonadales bacterium]
MTTDTPSAQQAAWLAQLTEFLRIPSISTLPDHAADCRRAADWLMAELRRLGCPTVELLEGRGHPTIWAESPRVEGAPTVLIYGHYDVQPVEPLDEWVSGPFEPQVRDGNLYARGAIDDKGQVFTMLKAYESVLDGAGRPPLNVRFIFEGEEECGGKVIFDILQRDRWRTEVDAVIVADMGYYAPGIPAVYTALRGLAYAEIHLRTAASDLHSGTYGGAAPNAIEEMVRLLARLKDANGRIKIPGLYEAVRPPSKAELAGWRKLPFNLRKYLKEEVTAKALTGIRTRSVFERTWALPTFEIHGIRGGFTGEGAKTVIPAAAVAKVSLRLVPGQKVATTYTQLARAVKAAAPAYATVEVKPLHGGEPVQVRTDHPAFAALDEAFQAVVGRKTVAVRAGGSIPVVTELAKGGAPVLLTGIGLPDDRLHAPNEKVTLQQVWDGIEVFGRFLRYFGK